MDFNTFKIYHSETIMYFQLIEHDLKWIYSYMHKGDQYKTFDSLEKTTLGTLVTKLKDLDMSDGHPYISASDYNFLKQMTQKRNYWCHQSYVDFMYEEEFLHSNEYIKISEKLQHDHDKLKVVCDNVENVRLKAVEDYKREK